MGGPRRALAHAKSGLVLDEKRRKQTYDYDSTTEQSTGPDGPACHLSWLLYDNS